MKKKKRMNLWFYAIFWLSRQKLASVLLRWSSKCRSAAGFPPATTRKTFLECPQGIDSHHTAVLRIATMEKFHPEHGC